MKSPFFSFVIANYNYGNMIEAAITSILNQSDSDYEIIVVDGGSTDNSLEVIKKYENRIAWWVSEPDTGQSNAFNKGFAHARGEFLTWLNADDILLPDTVAIVKKKLLKNPKVDWATGNFMRFDSKTGKILQACWGPHYLPFWLQGKKRVNVIFGPTTFWRRSVYFKLGPIDEELHYAMDVEYWARLAMNGYKQIRVNHFCWGFRMHEESKTAEFGAHERSLLVKEKMKKEILYIAKKTGYSPTKFYRYLGLLFRIIDGSLWVALYWKVNIVGKNINDYFKRKIDY